MQATAGARWRFKGPEMEGAVARWYARIRRSSSQLELYRKQAQVLTGDLARPDQCGLDHRRFIPRTASDRGCSNSSKSSSTRWGT